MLHALTTYTPRSGTAAAAPVQRTRVSVRTPRRTGSSGSAMIWAVVSILVLMVIVIGIMSVGQAYYNRSLKEDSRRQAQLTARSALDAILTQLDGLFFDVEAPMDVDGNILPWSEAIKLSDQIYKNYSSSAEYVWAQIKLQDPQFPTASGQRIYFTDFNFANNDVMGTVQSAWMERQSNGDLKVSATAAYHGETATLSALLKLSSLMGEGATELVDVPVLTTMQTIFHAFVLNNLNFPHMSNASKAVNYITSNGSDMYLIGNLNDAGCSIVSFRYNRMIHVNGGNFYTKYNIITPASYTGNVKNAQRGIRVKMVGLVSWSTVYIDKANNYYANVSNFGSRFVPREGIKANALVDPDVGVSTSFVTLPTGTVSASLFTQNSPASNVFVLRSGAATLSLSSLSGSEVFIFVEPSATLTLKGSNGNTRLYVYAARGATIKFDNNTVVNGAIVADTLSFSGNNSAQTAANFTVNFTRPVSGMVVEFANTIPGQKVEITQDAFYTYKWRFSTYE